MNAPHWADPSAPETMRTDADFDTVLDRTMVGHGTGVG